MYLPTAILMQMRPREDEKHKSPEPNSRVGHAPTGCEFCAPCQGLTRPHWVPRAESHRRKCQEGHVGDGSPESTSARSQGRAAPAMALRPPPCMHGHLSERWQCLSCSHISLASQCKNTNNNTCAQWRLSLVPSQSVDSSITTVLGGKWRPLVLPLHHAVRRVLGKHHIIIIFP